ncbi:MAG TPA: DUF4097 family beta strand repeat-containing protein [Pyrinomonadaceae bacterium]
MPESCHNCGAELFEGQQFCRRCGAQARGAAASAAGGEAPTQLFPQATQPSPAAAATSQVGGGTGQVAAQQPTAYHAPAGFQQTSPLVGQPFGTQPLAVAAPARRRGGGWLLALAAVFVLGAGLASVAAYVWWRATRGPVVVRRIEMAGGPRVAGAPAPPAPPDFAKLGERVREALAGAPLPLDESGAVVSGDSTVLTRVYELGEDASFVVHAERGDVTVTGAEGDSVVVKVVKRGGSAALRGASRVLEAKTDEGVKLLTAPAGDEVSVSYEVSVPRALRRLEISAGRGDVRVTGFAGAVTADVRQGEVEFRDVSGEVRSKVITGRTRVFQTAAEREGSQQFSVVRGDIEATFAEGAGADVKAQTLDGDIEVADGLGLRAERGPAGRHAAGRVGEGGEALVFKVTNGDIRLKK